MNNFLIYGAGKKGKWCLNFLEWRNMGERVAAFCDIRSAEIENINNKKVLSYEDAIKLKLPFLISVADSEIAENVLQKIVNDGGEGYLFDDFYKILDEDQVTFLREWCAYHHACDNNQWFEDAEKEESVEVFWGENTIFHKYFNELDLRNVIELACGRGRHVSHYMDKAGKITLVDILKENMVICRERFRDAENIVYYQNNGYNLEELGDNEYTALFTYDSMVHFEMMDVYTYLKDIYHVLKEGARALFHHSNYTKDYTVDFAQTPHARCFMGKDVFAYLANRAGFKILKQEVIDWYEESDLDCITLVEK